MKMTLDLNQRACEFQTNHMQIMMMIMMMMHEANVVSHSSDKGHYSDPLLFSQNLDYVYQVYV